jgi:hypothetical protein
MARKTLTGHSEYQPFWPERLRKVSSNTGISAELVLHRIAKSAQCGRMAGSFKGVLPATVAGKIPPKGPVAEIGRK